MIRSDSIVRSRMIVVITAPACVLEFVLVGGKLFPLQIRLLSGTVYMLVYQKKEKEKKRVTIEDEKAVSNAGDRHRKYRRDHDVFLIVTFEKRP